MSFKEGKRFWIESNTCRRSYRCGIAFTFDGYSAYVEFALFYPTLTVGYIKKPFRDYKEEKAIEKELK